MSGTIRRAIQKARSVLENNWQGSYTRPAAALYPHQWNWDSGFIAIGYSHFDTTRAMREVRSLFDAQWKNGMVPQIVFNRAALGSYFPEPDFWRTDLSPQAPGSHLTSGITMPPIHGVAVLKIYQNARDKAQVIPFLKWIFPKLLDAHRYLYRERNVAGDGLVHIRHPWESGMDNSPGWDRVLQRIDLARATLPEYRRKDTEAGIPAAMRPTRESYDHFVYLLELFKRHRYDEGALVQESPFLIADPLFNAILCASNEALVELGDILGEPGDEIEQWYRLTAGAIREKLYHEEHGMFDALDLRAGKPIELETASGFLPLFGGAATPAQAARIYGYLDSRGFCALHQGNCFTIPSYDTEKEGFRRENYWRGPVWININWMLVQGLRRYGFHQRADSLAHDILELPLRFGFHEYFDSYDGRGYGSDNFSWTAALFLDTAYETYLNTGEGSLAAKKILFTRRLLNAPDGTVKTASGRDIAQRMFAAIGRIRGRYYTPRGNVDYGAIRLSEEYREYRRIAAGLGAFDLESLQDRDERLAFWINLYNTIVVDGIIAIGIRRSVKEAVGFFSRIRYAIGGFDFSPDDIEHGILRANRRKPFRPWRQFGPANPKRRFALRELDPRIHFALVCGSRSCAPIGYYTPSGIDRELERAAQNFVNSSEVIVIPEENRILLSQIFQWYENDFGGRRGVLAFVCRQILDDDKKAFVEKQGDRIAIDYLYYDWALNR